MTTINDLSLDILTELFTYLDYSSAQKFRSVCSTLDSIYRGYRSSMSGPDCNAEIRSYRGAIRLKISHVSYKNPSIFVPLDSWPLLFKNANVRHLSITTDDCIPSELIPQLLCCQSVERIDYMGCQIDEAWLEALGSLATKTFAIRVRDWTEDFKGFSKREEIGIDGDVENLQKISNLMKKNVKKLSWNMTLENFTDSLDFLETHPESEFQIQEWTINIKKIPHGLDVHPLCERFFEKMIRCTKVRIDRSWDSSAHQLRIYKI